MGAAQSASQGGIMASKKDNSTSRGAATEGPVVLAILDGWGIGPKGPGNAIELAKTPNMDGFQKAYPHTRLMAHGRYAGLLPNQEGNSEAGHSNIGGGRVVRQDIVYVTEAIRDGTFYKNTAFREAIKHIKKYGTRLHLMGLFSNGNSAHASPEHLFALLKLANDEGIKDVRLHLFTDGRDAPPHSAVSFLHKLDAHLHPGQRIATVMGRFYAMDRNKLWHRTEIAYDAIVNGEGIAVPDAQTAVLSGYNRGETDEFILPSVVVDERKVPIGQVQDNDAVIFFNLRSDRARQLAKAFVQRDFEQKNDKSFKRTGHPSNTRFAAMTDFGPDLEDMFTAFPSRDLEGGLTEALAGHRQFYVGESEKYAHVTYFLNGGYADARFGEERMRVPSQFIPHHDLKPEMRAYTMTDEVIRRIKAGLNDFIAINFANADMVGHTGNLAAAIEAVQHVDACLGKLAKEVRAKDGVLVIVGDHGNAEKMLNEETGERMTEHTSNPVPFILVSDVHKNEQLGDGMLADVAPTLLDVLDIPKPMEMTGFSLLRD
jgi:2,3-bisphosphoglycerate-independent phosphoglycerate mutase